MPPGRRPLRSQEEFVEAGISFADEHGIEALTLRALGGFVGASTTAVYRYFPDKQALLAAMRDSLLAEVMHGTSAVEAPREQIRLAARSFRRVVIAHPCLGPLMTLPGLRGPAADQVPSTIAAALHDLGLRDRELVVAYRQLESFVVGSCVFDVAGAPQHLTDRLARMQVADRPEFSAIFTNAAVVEDINEAAFEASLDALLTSISVSAHRSS